MASQITVESQPGVAGLDREAWNRLVGDESPFLEHGFLAALEDTGCVGESTGWIPVILTARQEGALVGAVPMYIKMHSRGEFVFDWAWADAAQRAGIQYYPKAVVAVPFTPVTGARILVRDDIEPGDALALRKALISATVQVANDMGLSSIHYNFLLESELPAFEELGIPLRTGVQYHWKNPDGADRYECFDDFLARFRSKRRANIRRERRLLREDGVSIQTLVGDAIDHDTMSRMFVYYRATVQKFYWGHQYLNEDFFHAALDQFRDRLHLVTATRNGEYAGAFNLFKGDRLYGRYWGAARDVEFTHFEVCFYSSIEWCIANNVSVFEPGAGGEHKFERGFEATRTYSAHYLADPRLQQAIDDFLAHERSQIDRHVDLLNEESPYK